MIPIIRTLILAVTGTIAMTLFSVIALKVYKKNLRTWPVGQRILAWGSIYQCVFSALGKNETETVNLERYVVGRMEWCSWIQNLAVSFSCSSLADNYKRQPYYIQRLPAHIVFGLRVAYVYKT